MALEGSIRDFSLADIFQLIGIQRKSGILTLRQQNEEVKVSFLNGMVVNADSKSGRLDDRLGSVLVKSGKISQEKLERALQLQRETLKKLGNVLLDNELVRLEDLREALGIQITQIVYRLFRWKDGHYHFEQDVAVDYDKENFSPMSAESLLMEGMRMIDEWPIIERKITSFDMVFERVPLDSEQAPVVSEREESPVEAREGDDDFDAIFSGAKKGSRDEPSAGIKLNREENLVYEQINGQATVQEIIDRTMLSEFEICRSLYDLYNRNLIVPVAREQKVATGKEGAGRARARRAPIGGRFTAAAVWLWLVVALGLGIARRNPLNLIYPGATRGANLEGLLSQVAAVRVRRIANAIDVYVLQRRVFPASIDDLVAAGLLAPGERNDPWGRAIRFEVQSDRIVITGATGQSGDGPQLTEERRFPG